MSEENQNEGQGQEEVVLTEAEQQAQHDQAMIDKVDANEAKTEGSMQTDQEVMLAGKYKTVEELEKAYEHLQSKMGKPEGEEEAPEEPTADTESTTRDEAQQVASDSGVDYTALENEYQENGALSEDTYKALEAAGIPQNMVDSYIAGQEALTQATISNMYNIVGGEAEYTDMVQWAQDTLSESEVGAFNASLTNNQTTEFAIQGLHARYAAEKGPNLVRGATTNSSTSGFGSKAEMMTAMANPQYARDPAFRANVQRRVALSSF